MTRPKKKKDTTTVYTKTEGRTGKHFFFFNNKEKEVKKKKNPAFGTDLSKKKNYCLFIQKTGAVGYGKELHHTDFPSALTFSTSALWGR